MNPKRTTVAILALALLASAYVLYRNRQPADEYSLRLKWVYDPGFAGELVAKQQGYFAAEGLNLDIRPGGFEADPIKLVATKADTFGVAGADTFLLARDAGVPIVAFAAGYLQTPVVYYVKADASIHRVADFPGHRVGIQAGQDTETIYRAMLSKVGVDRNAVIEVPVQYDFSPFLADQVDVWPGYAASQSYTLHQKQIPYRTITPSESGITFVGTVYFTTEDMIQDHPEDVQAFLDAVINGWEVTYTQRETAVEAIRSFDSTSLTPDLIEWNLDHQRTSIKPEGRRYCELQRAELESMVQLLVGQGMLTTPVDVSRAFDQRFLEKHYQ